MTGIDARESGADPRSPRELVHELTNVLAALQMHLFLAGRDLGEGGETAEALSRLGALVDRATAVAATLDERLRAADEET